MVNYLHEIEKSAYYLLHKLMPTKVCFFLCQNLRFRLVDASFSTEGLDHQWQQQQMELQQAFLKQKAALEHQARRKNSEVHWEGICWYNTVDGRNPAPVDG